SRADDDWSHRAVVEERVLSDGTRIVLNPDPDLATVTVCLVANGFPHPDDAAVRELMLRGSEASMTEDSLCVSGSERAALSALSVVAQAVPAAESSDAPPHRV